MRNLSHEEAQALEAKQTAKMQSGGNSKMGQLLEKHHNDVFVVQSNRVSVPKGASPLGVGKLKSPGVIVLNNSLEEINTVAEHGFYYPAKQGREKYRVEPCLDYGSDDTKCPICKAARQKLHGAKFPYIRMGLTVLMDRIDESGQVVGYDKKFLVVKGENRTKFYEILHTASKNNNGNIRGLRFFLERGTADTSPGSGTPVVPVDGTPAYSFVGEEFLQQVQQAIQPEEVRSDDGKYLQKPAGWLTKPVNVNQNMDILGYSTEEELKKEFDPSYVHDLNSQPTATVPAATAAAPVPVATPVVPNAAMPTISQATTPANTTQAAPPVITPPAAPAVAVPPVPTSAPPVEAAPAIAQQRNLVPAAPSVQNEQQAVASNEVPWEQ